MKQRIRQMREEILRALDSPISPIYSVFEASEAETIHVNCAEAVLGFVEKAYQMGEQAGYQDGWNDATKIGIEELKHK